MTISTETNRTTQGSDADSALDSILDRLPELDFSDLDRLSADLPPLLAAMSELGVLTQLVGRFVADEKLRSMSERLAELDKLVLFRHTDNDVRIRMHIFRQGYWDRPHNHRFTFGTKLLRGSYSHTVYGHATDPHHVPADLLIPRLRRTENAGDGYVIEHTLVHSVAAAAQTITLTVRGPAEKDAMLIVGDDGPFVALGARQETAAELEQKRLKPEDIDELVALLQDSALID